MPALTPRRESASCARGSPVGAWRVLLAPSTITPPLGPRSLQRRARRRPPSRGSVTAPTAAAARLVRAACAAGQTSWRTTARPAMLLADGQRMGPPVNELRRGPELEPPHASGLPPREPDPAPPSAAWSRMPRSVRRSAPPPPLSTSVVAPWAAGVTVAATMFVGASPAVELGTTVVHVTERDGASPPPAAGLRQRSLASVTHTVVRGQPVLALTMKLV